MFKNYLFTLLTVFLFSSCSLQKGYVLFEDQEDEIVVTQTIKDYMRENPNPTIVLKAPNSSADATVADPNAYLYSAIEKELLIAGFDVKDRGLFNEVVDKADIDLNYEEIRKITNTQLLLELVHVTLGTEHNTNKFYKKDGEEKVTKLNFKRYGAVVEFKLIIIETNQYAGSYSFYYTPCTKRADDCNCEVAYKPLPGNFKIYPHLSFCEGDSDHELQAYETIPKDALVEFVRDGVSLMISEMKK